MYFDELRTGFAGSLGHFIVGYQTSQSQKNISIAMKAQILFLSRAVIVAEK